MRKMRVAFYAIIAILAVVIIGSVYYMLRVGGGSLPVDGQAPKYSATNIDGRTVSMDSLSGKIRLVTWFYTHCPDECPLTAFQMYKIQEQLKQEGLFGKDVVFVSISVDPTGDTPKAMHEFASEHHADLSNWYFLQTPADQLAPMLKSWGIETKQGTGLEAIEHAMQTDLIDENGNIRKKYTTAQLPVDEVMSDIHNLLSRQSW